MFSKKCQLSEQLPNNSWTTITEEAEVQIYYDPELYVARIAVIDDCDMLLLSNTLIGTNTVMNVSKRTKFS